MIEKVGPTLQGSSRLFPSCCYPHFKREAKCKSFHVKIRLHSNANETQFGMKGFAVGLAWKIWLSEMIYFKPVCS